MSNDSDSAQPFREDVATFGFIGVRREQPGSRLEARRLLPFLRGWRGLIFESKRSHDGFAAECDGIGLNGDDRPAADPVAFFEPGNIFSVLGEYQRLAPCGADHHAFEQEV